MTTQGSHPADGTPPSADGRTVTDGSGSGQRADGSAFRIEQSSGPEWDAEQEREFNALAVQFAHWLTQTQPAEIALTRPADEWMSDVRLMLQLKADQIDPAANGDAANDDAASESESAWTVAIVEELLFDVVPRMLMIDRDQYPLIPETLTLLLRLLHETGRWGMGASTLGVIGQYELPDDAGAAAPPFIDTLLAASTHGEIRIPMPVDQPTRGAVDEAEMEDGAGGLLDTLSQLSDLTEVGVCAADVTPDEAGQLEWRITGGPALFAAALTACELGDLTPPDGI